MSRAYHFVVLFFVSVFLSEGRGLFAAQPKKSHCEGLASWTGPFPPAAYFDKLRDIDVVSDFESLAELVAQSYGLTFNPEFMSLAREFVADNSLRDEFFTENLTHWMADTDFVVHPSTAPDTGSPKALLGLTKRARNLRNERAMAVVYELAMWLRYSPNIEGGHLAVMREGLRHFTDPQLKLRLGYTYHQVLTGHFFRDLDFLNLGSVERGLIARAALKLDPPDNDARHISGGVKSVFNDEISNFDSLLSKKTERLAVLKQLLEKYPSESAELSCLFEEFNVADRIDLLRTLLANIHKIVGIRSGEYAKERLIDDFGLKRKPVDWRSFSQGALGYIEFKNAVYAARTSLKNSDFLAQFKSLRLARTERLGFLRDILYSFPERLPALTSELKDLRPEQRESLARGYFDEYFRQMSNDDQARFSDYGEIMRRFDLSPDLNLLKPGSRQETFFSHPPGTPFYIRDFSNESDPINEVIFSIRNRPIYFLNGNFDGFFTPERFTPTERRRFAEELLANYLKHASDLRNKFPSLASIVAYFSLSPAEAVGLEWVYED